jgi:hypothetical protein
VETPHIPKPSMPTIASVRGTRWQIYLADHPRIVEALSWLVWLLVVALFAVWAHLHYSTPADPRWIGLTIRTSVFAIWTQVAREWLMVYLRHRTHSDETKNSPVGKQ